MTATLSAVASHDISAGHSCITWDELVRERASCPEYVTLLDAIRTDPRTCPDDLKPYAKVFNELTYLQGVAMLQNRIVIPKKLRDRVLQFLHAAHAGVQAMMCRATSSVYWPCYKHDIENVRKNCTSCCEFAPSNPPMFPTPDADIPSYPFQVVCTDFFDWRGKSYLILVDKYSNWLSVLKLPRDDSKSLIDALRQYISIFGVPEQLCSDGATVYTSELMKSFCQKWDIYRKESALLTTPALTSEQNLV